MNSVLIRKQNVVSLLNELDSGTYSINQVVQELPFSKKIFLHFIDEIDKEFQELFQYKLIGRDKKIHWSKEKFQINTYNQYLIQQSIPYRFILYMLLYPEKNLEEFSKDVFISLSSVRRNLQSLVTYLKKFDIKLRLSSMEIEGNEFEIRMVFHSILWFSSLGKDIFAVVESTSEDIFLEQLGFKDSIHINTQEYLLFLLITKLRIRQGHYLTYFPLKSLHKSEKEYTAILSYLQKYIANSEILLSEQKFLAYKLYYSGLFSNIDDIRLSTLNRYRAHLSKHEDEYQKLLGEFLSEVETRGNITNPNSQALISANLFSVLLMFFLTKRPSPNMFDLSLKSNEKRMNSQAISSFVKTFFTKVARRKSFYWLGPVINEVADYITPILQPYWNYEKKRVHIGIPSFSNHLLESELVNFLSSFSFVEIFYEEKQNDNIDLFITPFREFVLTGDTPLFFIDFTGLSKHNKHLLFIQLYELYENKNQR